MLQDETHHHDIEAFVGGEVLEPGFDDFGAAVRVLSTKIADHRRGAFQHDVALEAGGKDVGGIAVAQPQFKQRAR
ncbi:hypothetical protein D3C84_1252910 [compost metagenome]